VLRGSAAAATGEVADRCHASRQRAIDAARGADERTDELVGAVVAVPLAPGAGHRVAVPFDGQLRGIAQGTVGVGAQRRARSIERQRTGAGCSYERERDRECGEAQRSISRTPSRSAPGLLCTGYTAWSPGALPGA